MILKPNARASAIAMAIALAAGGANAAIDNSNQNFGNSSALFVAMDGGSAGTPSHSIVIDLGVSMGDFLKTINNVNQTAGALSGSNTFASWNFGDNTRTVNGQAVAGDYDWSSSVSSFFSSAQGDVRWGVIGADNISGAVSSTNTLANRNMLATGAPTQANINQVNSPAAISSGIGAFQNFVGAQPNVGAGHDAGANTSTSGATFLNTTLRGNFNNQLPWNYLSAVDTTSNLFLVNQQSNSVVYQLGDTYGMDTLLTQGMASFHYDSATNSLSYMAAAPVPEPETFAMLLAGMAMVGAVVRRRNRRG